MNGYLSNVKKYLYVLIWYIDINVVEDRVREKGWDSKFCDIVLFYLYDKRLYYIYLIVSLFKLDNIKNRYL